MTVFGKVWSSSQKLVLKNKGGGSIAWSMVIENDAGGTYTLESGPTSGGLGRNQSQELTFSCTPTSLGWQEGMILIKNRPARQAGNSLSDLVQNDQQSRILLCAASHRDPSAQARRHPVAPLKLSLPSAIKAQTRWQPRSISRMPGANHQVCC